MVDGRDVLFLAVSLYAVVLTIKAFQWRHAAYVLGDMCRTSTLLSVELMQALKQTLPEGNPVRERPLPEMPAAILEGRGYFAGPRYFRIGGGR